MSQEKPRRRPARRSRTAEAAPRTLEPEVLDDDAEPAPESVQELTGEPDLSAVIPELVAARSSERDAGGALVPFDPLQRYLQEIRR